MIKKWLATGYFILASLFISPVCAEDKYLLETYQGELERHASITRNLFNKGQWDKLDKLLADARKHQKRTSFGTSLLWNYYAGCSAVYFFNPKDPDAKWLDYKKRLEKWENAQPESITVKCLIMKFWISYAWKARGDGFANTVKENDWKLFTQRLEKAEHIYLATKKKYGEKIVPCPEFYTTSLKIALGQNWKKKKAYEELVMPVIKSWPLYHYVYAEYAHLLQPQWQGNAGDDYKFYNSLKKTLGGELGKEVSAYCIFLAHETSLNEFRYDLVDQDEMIEGMLSHLRRNPNDADLIKRIVEFSTRYDFETTQQLVKDIREITPNTFKQFEEGFSYGKTIKAMMDTPNKSIQKEYYLRPKSSPFIRPIRSVSTQDGVDHLVYAQGWDALVVLRDSDSKILAIERTKNNDPICYEAVALSKSGDHIFVEVRHKGRRIFRIYSLKDNKLELIKSVPGPLGFTEHAEFVEDDQTILIAGEERGSNFKTSLYYRWKWKTEEPQLIAKSPRGRATKLEVLEDKKQVICYSDSNLLYYNYTEKQPTIHKIKLNVGEENPTVYDIHYAKEIDALAIITKKDNYLAILDAKTFKLKAAKKLFAQPAFAALVDGYKHGKNEYTFCVSGDIGLISVFHYNSKQKEPISYESTIVNATYHASHISVIEKPGAAPRIIQAYYQGGIIGCYTVKE